MNQETLKIKHVTPKQLLKHTTYMLELLKRAGRGERELKMKEFTDEMKVYSPFRLELERKGLLERVANHRWYCKYTSKDVSAERVTYLVEEAKLAANRKVRNSVSIKQGRDIVGNPELAIKSELVIEPVVPTPVVPVVEVVVHTPIVEKAPPPVVRPNRGFQIHEYEDGKVDLIFKNVILHFDSSPSFKYSPIVHVPV